MHCPNCLATDTKVIETRILQQGLSVRRRRKCEACDKRFTTYENINIQLPVVVKADGRRENFNRDKIIRGLSKACQKRPVSADQIEALVTSVAKRLSELSMKEVSSDHVGNFTMEELFKLDPVAYVRFASFYWNFNDVESFVQSLQTNLRFQNHNPELKGQYDKQ